MPSNVERAAELIRNTPGDWPGREREQEWSEYIAGKFADADPPILLPDDAEIYDEYAARFNDGHLVRRSVTVVRGEWEEVTESDRPVFQTPNGIVGRLRPLSEGEGDA